MTELTDRDTVRLWEEIAGGLEQTPNVAALTGFANAVRTQAQTELVAAMQGSIGAIVTAWGQLVMDTPKDQELHDRLVDITRKTLTVVGTDAVRIHDLHIQNEARRETRKVVEALLPACESFVAPYQCYRPDGTTNTQDVCVPCAVRHALDSQAGVSDD